MSEILGSSGGPWLMVAAALVLAYAWWRAPELAHGRGGQALLFLVAFPLAIAAGAVGLTKNLRSATETRFCLSCHEMEPYGMSLRIDDSEPVPAVHYQNRLVPRDHACFTCHTDYTMFGDVKAKLNGMRHLYVHYTRTVPERIALYRPFDNRNCLHCHDGARTFEERPVHRKVRAALGSGETSCLAAGCHDVGHLAHELEGEDLWSPEPAR